MTREILKYDVLIVGAGPAGLSCAIRLKQLAPELSVCIIEKGSEVGAHILSGAVLEPRALNELLPDWKNQDPPLHTPVTEDQFLWLTARRSYRLPTPLPMRNQGNFIISLENFCRWLARIAESLGVEIYPGFAGTEILYDERGTVVGIATGDKGLDKQGQPTDRFQAGIAIHAKQTILSEGCRGSLTKMLIERFQLDRDASPPTYGLGIKELWEIDPRQHQPGKVVHTIGWPMDFRTYGGSFLYHLEKNLVAVGFVVGLDYQNTYLNPFEEFQRFKTHPAIRTVFTGGKRIGYGARALMEGGFQSLPKLTFPGGLLIGDTAGFLNVPKIKGTHTAMKSGMVAAEVLAKHFSRCVGLTSLSAGSRTFHVRDDGERGVRDDGEKSVRNDGEEGGLQSDAGKNVRNDREEKELTDYTEQLKKSWVWKELYLARNIRPSFRFGLWGGLLYSALDTYLLRGHAPWTFKNHADYQQLKETKFCKKINYPKPDGKLTFDKLSSVYLSNTSHEENQICHLQLKDSSLAIDINFKEYNSPEQRYCPAGVYEIVRNNKGEPRLQINAPNCIHCKTCDIKDPKQNINWVPPEGGGGPNYQEM